MTVDQLKAQLSQLNDADRKDVLDYLQNTFDQLEPEDGWDAEWEAELDRRKANMLSGKTKSRPAADVTEELLREYP